MSDDAVILLARIVDLLESIDGKLDRLEAIEDSLDTMKLDVSGFEHDGTKFEGVGERILDVLSSIASNTS